MKKTHNFSMSCIWPDFDIFAGWVDIVEDELVSVSKEFVFTF